MCVNVKSDSLMLKQSGGRIFFTHILSFDFQAQWALLQKEREHRECCLEVQHLCTQLEKAQGSLHSQELELERLRPLEKWLGQYQREQQVSRTVGTYTSSGRLKLGTNLKTG